MRGWVSRPLRGNKDAGCCTDVCENRSNGSDTEIKSVDEESKEELI